MSITKKGFVRVKTQTALGTAETSGFTFVDAQDDSIPTVALNKSERNGLRQTRNPQERIPTTKESSIELRTIAKGTSTNSGTGVVPIESAETIPLLGSLFGQVSTASTGDTVGASASNDEINVGTFPADPVEVGQGLLVRSSVGSAKYQYRVVTAAADPVYTLHQATINEETGAAGSPATGGTEFYTGATYTFGSSVDHPFVTVDRQTETDRWILEGATVQSAALEVPDDGSPLMWTFSLDAQDHDKTESLSGDSFSLAAEGSPILGINSPLTIGAVPYCGFGFSFTFANGAARKPTTCGPNGFQGHAAVAPMVDFSFTIYTGTDNGEGAKNIAATLEAGLHDLTFQFGRSQGAAIGIRIPEGDLSVVPGTSNGLDTMVVSGSARGDTLAQVTIF